MILIPDVDESKDATGLYASLEEGAKTRDEALQDAIDV